MRNDDKMRYGDFARNAGNYNGDDSVEYFEDTHRGGSGGSGFGGSMPQYSQTPSMQQHTINGAKYMSTPYFKNVLVYEPRIPEDVQLIIDHMKSYEPAVVNLESVEPETAQRILDFVSGATYALSGSVHRISGNIFLLSPQGVGITVPYESK